MNSWQDIWSFKIKNHHEAVVSGLPMDRALLGMIPIMIGAFPSLFAIPGAILGIAAWGRNKLKLQAQPPAQMLVQQMQRNSLSLS
jgi:hypothetical protein